MNDFRKLFLESSDTEQSVNNFGSMKTTGDLDGDRTHVWQAIQRVHAWSLVEYRHLLYPYLIINMTQ